MTTGSSHGGKGDGVAPTSASGDSEPVIIPDDVELIPAIELHPARFGTEERRRPRVPWHEDPEGWRTYWDDCLSDAGIHDLSPISGMLVATADLKPARVLATVCEKHFLQTDWTVEPEVLAPFEGGYVLRSSLGVHVTPTCCGDLDDLFDWQKAVSHRGREWSMLWIGHPWLSIREETDGRFGLTKPHETDAVHLSSAFIIGQDALRRAIERAREERDRFRERLVPVVRGLVPGEYQVEPIVDALTGQD